MKLLRYAKDEKVYVGLSIEEGIIDLAKAGEVYKNASKADFCVPGDVMGWIKSYSNLYGAVGEIVEFVRRHNLVEWLVERDVKVLAPIDKPSKIICLGLNYSEHASERGYEVPEEPVIFAKIDSTINDPDADVLCTKDLGRVDPEAELALIISKTAKNVKKEDAFEYVLGYTALNDFTARGMKSKDKSGNKPWFRSKNIDGFCPIGPHIVFKEDIENPHNLDIRLEVNGEIRQDSNTDKMIFKIPEMIEYITSMVTLNPGDIIATGTPSGIQAVGDGDVMEVIIEGVGRLRNTVRIV